MVHFSFPFCYAASDSTFQYASRITRGRICPLRFLLFAYPLPRTFTHLIRPCTWFWNIKKYTLLLIVLLDFADLSMLFSNGRFVSCALPKSPDSSNQASGELKNEDASGLSAVCLWARASASFTI